MKKEIIISLLFFSILILQGCQIEVEKPLKGEYCQNGGKDTTLEFGKECEYALLQGYEDKEIDHYTNKINDLYNQKKNESISSPIYAYKEKEKFVYMIGKNRYLLFDKKKNVLNQEIELSSLSPSQQLIFNELEKEKKKIINKIKKEAH